MAKPAAHPTAKVRKEAAERAREWREFRHAYLFNQGQLAQALRCGKRTIAAIEGAEVYYPHVSLLRRFQALKQRHEKAAATHAQITSRLPVYDANQLFERRA